MTAELSFSSLMTRILPQIVRLAQAEKPEPASYKRKDTTTVTEVKKLKKATDKMNKLEEDAAELLKSLR